MYTLCNSYRIWDNFGMMGWSGVFMMIVFSVLLITFIFLLVRELNNRSSRTALNALDILKERYAKGEINKVEFEEMKKNLS